MLCNKYHTFPSHKTSAIYCKCHFLAARDSSLAPVQRTLRRGNQIPTMAPRLGFRTGSCSGIQWNAALQWKLKFVHKMPKTFYQMHTSGAYVQWSFEGVDAKANASSVCNCNVLLCDASIWRNDVDSAVYGAGVPGVRRSAGCELDDGKLFEKKNILNMLYVYIFP